MPSSTPFYDLAVIGSGIAGLTCAALSQHDGLQVLALEAHDKVGGCAGYFNAGQFQFSVGATVALGYEDSGLHRRIFDYLNIASEADLLDGLQVLLPDRRVFIARHDARWKRERKKLNGQRRAQEKFWRIQELLADGAWRMLSKLPSLPLQLPIDIARDLRLLHPSLALVGPGIFFSVQKLLQVLGLNTRADRAFLALLELQLGITSQNGFAAPLTNACAGIDLFRHGGWHPRGGIGSIARTLQHAFERDGGDLKLNTRVSRIVPISSRGKISHYEIYAHEPSASTCRCIGKARRVVANTTLLQVQQMLEMPENVQTRLEKYQSRGGNQWGAVTLYVALRDGEMFENGAMHWQVLDSYTPKLGDGRDVFLSLSARDDLECAPTGFRTLNISTHTNLADWRELSPDEYRIQKRQWRNRMLEIAHRAIGDLSARRKFVIAGTPRSWQHFALREGVGGWAQRVANANLFAVPSRIGMDNFWIVGDSTFPGQGTVACALSGLNAWRDITGKMAL